MVGQRQKNLVCLADILDIALSLRLKTHNKIVSVVGWEAETEIPTLASPLERVVFRCFAERASQYIYLSN